VEMDLKGVQAFGPPSAAAVSVIPFWWRPGVTVFFPKR
jgi:hypothetical protein